MPRKYLLTMSLLMLLIAVSASAQAGTTISDKRYWPGEAGQSAPPRIDPRPGIDSAFAYDRATSRFEPVIRNGEGSAWSYHGGPQGR